MDTRTTQYFEVYRRSSIGRTLMDALDDLIEQDSIEPQLAMKILRHFDRSITEVLYEKAEGIMTFKGHLDTYNLCDEVWTFAMKDVTCKMDDETVKADRLKIVSCSNKKE